MTVAGDTRSAPPRYVDHLRQMAGELGHGRTPRDVDAALYML